MRVVCFVHSFMWLTSVMSQPGAFDDYNDPNYGGLFISVVRHSSMVCALFCLYITGPAPMDEDVEDGWTVVKRGKRL
jgi:hypothetical protein